MDIGGCRVAFATEKQFSVCCIVSTVFVLVCYKLTHTLLYLYTFGLVIFPLSQVYAESKIDGKTIYKAENPNPLQFSNVEVYVGNTGNVPTNGSIRNLMLESFDMNQK